MKCASCGHEYPAGGIHCAHCENQRGSLQPQFATLETQYGELQARYKAGAINREGLQASMQDLVTQDASGDYWSIGQEDGQWYWHDGSNWVRRDPVAQSITAKTGQGPDRRWILGGGILVAGCLLLSVCGIGSYFGINLLGASRTSTQATTEPTAAALMTAPPDETPPPTEIVAATLQAPTAAPDDRIGPAGGDVSGPQGVTVTFPEGAVDEDLVVNLQPVQPPEIPEKFAIQPAGEAVEVALAGGPTLNQMATLKLPVQKIPGGSEDRYTVLRWDGNGWEDVGGLLGEEAIEVHLSHFSIFQPVYSDIVRRPVSFVNHGPFHAGVHTWTFIALDRSQPVPFPAASTVSFGPDAPGLWPNPSRFLSLPLGTYTWCFDWDTGEDRDEDGYRDWFHFIDDRPVTLTEDSPDSHDLAVTVDFSTDPADPTPGRCGSAASGGGIRIFDGNANGFSHPPQVVAFANVEHAEPPEGVTISSGGELWRYNEVAALMAGGHWMEATTQDSATTAVGVQILGDQNDGWARILVDGQPVWQGSVYGSDPDWHGGAFVRYISISGLEPGPHTIRVEALGIPGQGGGDDVAIYFFGFGSAPPQP